MTEEPLSFGADDALVGILTSPAAAAGGVACPTVLLWNAGLLHRVGPARLYVRLARRLAEAGLSVLRFDLTGCGDSAVPTGTASSRARALTEIREAMDTIQARAGQPRFVLVGLCTGADQAHAVAVADARVVGAVCIDGYAYPTRRFWVRRLAGCATNPRRLAALMARVRRGRAAAADAARRDEPPGMFDWQSPPREQVAAELASLAARGARLLYLYSGESASVYNYAGQFTDMFPGVNLAGRVDHGLMEGADHLFSLPGNGAQFLEAVGGWIIRHFGKRDSCA